MTGAEMVPAVIWPEECEESPKGLTPKTLSPFAPSGNHAVFSEGPRAILRRGDTVTPRAVDWVWPGWLPAGKMAIIGGAPGCGKTTIAGALGATITTGGRWPDGTRARPGAVVIWSGEDGVEDTLAPRMMAAGADMSRVHFVDGIRENGKRYPFDPARDMAPLAAAMQEVGDVRLLVVDPIVSAAAGDSHKNAEVRRSLQPLVDLAEAKGCALLGVTHFTKGTQGRDPVERITGSLAFGALARLVMVAAMGNPGSGPERLLVRAKSNLGPNGNGYGYAVEHGHLVPGYPDIETSRVLWGSPVEGTARELLSEAEEAEAPAPARTAAAEWLGELLAGGPVESAEIRKAARDAGFTWGTVRNAKDMLGIKAKKSAMQGGWVWQVEETAPLSEECEGAKGSGVSPFANSSDSSAPSEACPRCDGEGCAWCR